MDHDFQNGGKGNDAQPIIAFHGTSKNFNVFDIGLAREKAIFFTDDVNEAYKFAGEDGFIFEARLLIDSLLTVDGATLPMHHTKEDILDIVKTAKAGGHDGVHIVGFRDIQPKEIDTWMVLDPEKIQVLARRNGGEVRREQLEAQWSCSRF